jgi:hypothetical protein
MVLVGSVAASVAQPRGCSAPAEAADGNLVVRCRHLTIEIEQHAGATLTDHDRDGDPDVVTLRSGAIYLTEQSRLRRRAFQVHTPDAIASVRGTEWAVDVSAAETAAFVVKGSVAVQRRIDGQSVVLGPGEGVDVAPERNPLVVKRWPPARVKALLARFGR